MHLTVISCTPRSVNKSNTDKILKKFIEGFESQNNSSKIYYLSKRNTWQEIRQAFYGNNNLLFAIPLFVECIPGILLEFLETLEPKQDGEYGEKTKISFILQGGFAEASQLRCGEEYLEKLPGYFNCEYAGTLIKGNMFAISMIEEKRREAMIQPFVEMGAYYAKHGVFHKDKVSEFAKPEYFSKRFITFYKLISPLQKMFMSAFAKKLGCKTSLKAKPYEKYME